MNEEQLKELRHSCAHLLAAAVVELWPEAKRTIGPAIENGFYYDFDFGDTKVTEEDFTKIENTMRKLLKRWEGFERSEVTVEEAKEAYAGNEYKHELIDQFSGEEKVLTLYKSGNFTDLCRGGHCDNPKNALKHFKLMSVAGAYWRGDEKNKMLTRIYGACFETSEELETYLHQQEEAKKRDHRKLGKELDLFSIVDQVGGGLPLFYPKGTTLRRNVEELIHRLQTKRGYETIWVPHITKGELYKISGHLDKYDAMFPPMEMDNEQYYLKPMNCPHFMMLYKSRPHSYRDLPVRWVSTTSVYRYEKSGELSGLTRVRSITQDDCHVFVRPDQIEQEIDLMLDMLEEIYSIFGFEDFWVSISTHDPNDKEKYLGDAEVWKSSEAALKGLIEKRGWKHEVVEGEAAFYGPKLDFMFRDAIGRQWQLSTIQLDMNLPERFELHYIDDHGEKQQPVVIHRALLGSVERFLGILIEHYAGAFPFWLAPVQIRLATVSDAQNAFAKELFETLFGAGLRVELDDSSEKVGKKIRNSAQQKIPWTIVLGDKEVAGGDYKVNVFGQDDDLEIKASDLLETALEQSSVE